MELNNEFKVSVPLAKAWSVLTDLERIAPCLPGAQLQEVDGDEYKGTVKVKVGPITAQYKGVARLGELDEAAGRIVLNADGRDSRGQGNASAVVTATLAAEGNGTRVKVSTELNITGKVAQMGRGVLSDVSTKLMDQFAEALEADLSSQDKFASAPPATPVSSGTSSGPRHIESNEPEAIDLNVVAGMPVARRVGPIVGTLVVVLWLLRRRRKRRRS